jgi:potassium-transporting ATPase ATP-binding subunit
MTPQFDSITARSKTSIAETESRLGLKHIFYRRALLESVAALHPNRVRHNPVRFMTVVGSLLATGLFIRTLVGGGGQPLLITGALATWLWLTVLVANFAEALAEGHIQSRVGALHRTRHGLKVKKLSEAMGGDDYQLIPAASLRRGDLVLVEAGQMIPADGHVIAGLAPVDENGLSEVVANAPGERCAVIGGTGVPSNRLVVCITAEPGEGLLDLLRDQVERAKQRRATSGIVLNILLGGLAIGCLLVAVAWLLSFSHGDGLANQGIPLLSVTLVALLVSLLPLTTSGLLSIVEVAGLDRLFQCNVVALSDGAMERASGANVLFLDKRAVVAPHGYQAVAFIPLGKAKVSQVAEAARLAWLRDETPEGRSILALADKQRGLEDQTLHTLLETSVGMPLVPYLPRSGLSGTDFDGVSIRHGPPGAIIAHLQAQGRVVPKDLAGAVRRISDQGGIPRVIVLNDQLIGMLHLKEMVREGLKERLARSRQMGLKTALITADHPVAAAAVAADAGLDDFLAQATPALKQAYLKGYQADGQRVALTSDDVDNASLLARADVAVAMNASPPPICEAADMIDLDGDPTKLIEILEIARQWLLTRRALTILSVAMDVARYVALIPAAFAAIYPALGTLNFLHLATPTSALLATVIFSASSIAVLTPAAVRGVPTRLLVNTGLRRWSLGGCLLGGLLAPFIGLKVIDMLLISLGLS